MSTPSREPRQPDQRRTPDHSAPTAEYAAPPRTIDDSSKGTGGGDEPPHDGHLRAGVGQARDALELAARRARESRYRTFGLLVVLIAIAAAAVLAGLVADNAVFWSSAGLIFLAAFSAIVVYAARELGIFSQTAEMISRLLKGSSERLADTQSAVDISELKAQVRAELEKTTRAQLACEAGWNLWTDADLDVTLFPDLSDVRAVFREAQRMLGIAAESGSAPAMRYLGQLSTYRGDEATAEYWYWMAMDLGDVAAAYFLGRLHVTPTNVKQAAAEWTARAATGDLVAAYVLGRCTMEDQAAEVFGDDMQLPEPPKDMLPSEPVKPLPPPPPVI